MDDNSVDEDENRQAVSKRSSVPSGTLKLSSVVRIDSSWTSLITLARNPGSSSDVSLPLGFPLVFLLYNVVNEFNLYDGIMLVAIGFSNRLLNRSKGLDGDPVKTPSCVNFNGSQPPSLDSHQHQRHRVKVKPNKHTYLIHLECLSAPSHSDAATREIEILIPGIASTNNHACLGLHLRFRQESSKRRLHQGHSSQPPTE